jgi:hypothetical protein
MGWAPNNGLRTGLLRFLARLTDKQFADLFYEASALRRVEGSHMGLVHATRSGDRPWSVFLIARIDRDHYLEKWPEFEDFDDSVGHHQEGTCSTCRLDVVCVAKYALCPVCGRNVYCT